MKNKMKHNASFSSSGPRSLWPSVSNYVLQVSSPDDSRTPMILVIIPIQKSYLVSAES